MAQEYFVLSNFGVRYVLEDYTDSSTIPAGGSNELTSVISSSIGGITKETKRYKTLNGGGWDTIAPLGQGQEDATFELVRDGTGDPYISSTGTSTYNKLKDWFMKSAASGGAISPKCVVEVIPRGDDVFEGVCYYVVPLKWGAGKKDPESGQEYSFDVSPFGPQIPVRVTHVKASGEIPESWTFEKIS